MFDYLTTITKQISKANEEYQVIFRQASTLGDQLDQLVNILDRIKEEIQLRHDERVILNVNV